VPPEFLETEIAAQRILTDRCRVKEGTQFFLRVPNPLWSNHIKYTFLWKRGEEIWDIPHGRVVMARELPYRHKSKPINRMINYARSSDGFRLEDSKLLLRLLAEDFWCKVGWYPEGWMMCHAPYIAVDIRSMDRGLGRHVIDNALEHPFLERI
jgi:hypothetical protein